MRKYFHGNLLSGAEPQRQLLFGHRAVGAKFQPRACSHHAFHNRSSNKTTPRLEILVFIKNDAEFPFKFNCAIKPVTSKPRKRFDDSYRPLRNVPLSRNISLQSQVHEAVLHPRSKRPILKYIHHLDELLSALAPYARCSEPFEGSFRGIEACMAMNHLHRLRFQCQVRVYADCRLQQALSQQLTSHATRNLMCCAGIPKWCD
jgi:hypothetical protein